MNVSHRPTPTENRLILLLMLEKLGACSAQQLLALTTEGEIMDYIELQIGPVSYTHLDVYKRQLSPCSASTRSSARARRSFGCWPAGSGREGPRGTKVGIDF